MVGFSIYYKGMLSLIFDINMNAHVILLITVIDSTQDLVSIYGLIK